MFRPVIGIDTHGGAIEMLAFVVKQLPTSGISSTFRLLSYIGNRFDVST